MSRLLDKGPHAVTVTPLATARDDLGRITVPGSPVALTSVMIQPVTTSDSDQASSTVGVTSWRVLGAGTWPGGPGARVRVDLGPPGLQGAELDQSGEALHRACGRRTPHFTVTLTSRSREV